jgi:hypothetical protein
MKSPVQIAGITILPPRAEKTPRAWVLRFLQGPARILDGIVYTITLGQVLLNASTTCARYYAREQGRMRRLEIEEKSREEVAVMVSAACSSIDLKTMTENRP